MNVFLSILMLLSILCVSGLWFALLIDKSYDCMLGYVARMIYGTLATIVIAFCGNMLISLGNLIFGMTEHFEAIVNLNSLLVTSSIVGGVFNLVLLVIIYRIRGT